MHSKAQRANTTTAELAPPVLREKRRKAMMGIVGIWKDRDGIGDATEHIRKMRRSTRLQRLAE